MVIEVVLDSSFVSGESLLLCEFGDSSNWCAR